MKVKSYRIEDILVIEPQEKFLTGDDIKELEDKFAEAYAAGNYRVIMDFSRTELIYSAFISVLLEYSQKLRQKGGRIKLANPGLEVKKIVEVTHLGQIFEIYSNLEEALDSFRKERYSNVSTVLQRRSSMSEGLLDAYIRKGCQPVSPLADMVDLLKIKDGLFI